MSDGTGRISVESVARAAADIAGRRDGQGVQFDTGLRLLLRSCADTGALTDVGRRVLRSMAVRRVVNQHRISDYTRRHPDVAEGSVRGCMVITGLPRTGTTLLHNLLALDEEARFVRLWEALQPAPGTEQQSEAELIEQASTWLQRFYELVPEFRAIHPLTPEGPEECDALLQNAFASQHLEDMFDAQAYSSWLTHADLRAEYDYYVLQLRILSHGEQPRPWVLKSPGHLGHLDALLAALPDAVVVYCHRNPCEAVSSHASLVCALRRHYSARVSAPQVARQSLQRLSAATSRALAVRDRVGPRRFIDVAFPALVRDPLRTVDAIYERLGRHPSDDSRRAMQRWSAANPRDKHGVHRYEQSDFGLTPQDVTTAFEPYLDRFHDLLS